MLRSDGALPPVMFVLTDFRFGCDLITVNSKKDNRDSDSPPGASADATERRRIGRIVRDDRDTASVEWVDAPSDYKRVHLSIEGTLPGAGAKRASKGYNPYETTSPSTTRASPDKRPVKRDLRKLSEWIKQMRVIEERKKLGDADDD
jgi:hypothetical protein